MGAPTENQGALFVLVELGNLCQHSQQLTVSETYLYFLLSLPSTIHDDQHGFILLCPMFLIYFCKLG